LWPASKLPPEIFARLPGYLCVNCASPGPIAELFPTLRRAGRAALPRDRAGNRAWRAELWKTEQVHLVDNFGVHGENALHALAKADFAHGENWPVDPWCVKMTTPLERLQTLFVAFLDLHMHADGVASAELGKIARFVLARNFS